MEVNEKIAIDHGLKKDEFKKICDLLKESQILLNLEYFQQCGMNIALINHRDFILKNYLPKEKK